MATIYDPKPHRSLRQSERRARQTATTPRRTSWGYQPIGGARRSGGATSTVVTGDGVDNDVGFELYVGGATDLKGARVRMRSYLGAKRKGVGAENGAHLALALKPSCQIDLRLIAEFDCLSIPRPYVYPLREGAISVPNVGSKRPERGFHKGARPLTMEILRQCTPSELLNVQYQGLNRACQLKQMTRGNEAEKICADCSTTTAREWYHSFCGQAFYRYLMHRDNCVLSRRRRGVLRTKEMQQHLEAIRARPTKPDDRRCQHCADTRA